MPDPVSGVPAPMLAAAAGLLLPALAYLLVKHLFADFFFQTPRQIREKGTYGALGGLTHAATHVALTIPVFALLPPASAGVAVALLAGEFVLHYHIDWVKEQIVRRAGLMPGDDKFWWALGGDQCLHALTYVGMIWLIARSY